jgi:hypothetical protein
MKKMQEKFCLGKNFFFRGGFSNIVHKPTAVGKRATQRRRFAKLIHNFCTGLSTARRFAFAA